MVRDITGDMFGGGRAGSQSPGLARAKGETAGSLESTQPFCFLRCRSRPHVPPRTSLTLASPPPTPNRLSITPPEMVGANADEMMKHQAILVSIGASSPLEKYPGRFSSELHPTCAVANAHDQRNSTLAKSPSALGSRTA